MEGGGWRLPELVLQPRAEPAGEDAAAANQGTLICTLSYSFELDLGKRRVGSGSGRVKVGSRVA